MRRPKLLAQRNTRHRAQAMISHGKCDASHSTLGSHRNCRAREILRSKKRRNSSGLRGQTKVSKLLTGLISRPYETTTAKYNSKDMQRGLTEGTHADPS